MEDGVGGVVVVGLFAGLELVEEEDVVDELLLRGRRLTGGMSAFAGVGRHGWLDVEVLGSYGKGRLVVVFFNC